MPVLTLKSLLKKGEILNFLLVYLVKNVCFCSFLVELADIDNLLLYMCIMISFASDKNGADSGQTPKKCNQLIEARRDVFLKVVPLQAKLLSILMQLLGLPQ